MWLEVLSEMTKTSLLLPTLRTVQGLAEPTDDHPVRHHPALCAMYKAQRLQDAVHVSTSHSGAT